MNFEDIGRTEIAAGLAVLLVAVNTLYVNGVAQELNDKIEAETAKNADAIAANRQAIIDQWPKPDLTLTDHHIFVGENKVCFEYETPDASIQEWWPSTIWYPYNGSYRQQNIGRMQIVDGQPRVCYYLDSWRDLNQVDWKNDHYIQVTHQDPVFPYNLTISAEDRRNLSVHGLPELERDTQ